jgi:hypothetical protein
MADALVEIGRLARLLGRFAVGGSTGIQNEQRYTGLVKQLAQLVCLNGLCISFELGVLEEYLAAQAMTVEMDCVERLAFRLGLAQAFGELLEGGRPKHFQVERLARLAGQAANEVPCNGSERYAVAFEPADREQDPNLPGSRIGRRTQRGLGVTADERGHAQRQRPIRNRVAQKFPRHQGVFDFGLDLDSRIAEAVAYGIPDFTSRKCQAEQFPPCFAHALFDSLRDLRRGLYRIDPVILQIPADIFGVLGG